MKSVTSGSSQRSGSAAELPELNRHWLTGNLHCQPPHCFISGHAGSEHVRNVGCGFQRKAKGNAAASHKETPINTWKKWTSSGSVNRNLIMHFLHHLRDSCTIEGTHCFERKKKAGVLLFSLFLLLCGWIEFNQQHSLFSWKLLNPLKFF